jgi:hypothetical protein
MKKSLLKIKDKFFINMEKAIPESTYEHSDKLGEGAKKRKKLHLNKDKFDAVMHEFKRGTLRSGSGEHVKDHNQAVAIAMHESGMAKAESPEVQAKIKKVMDEFKAGKLKSSSGQIVTDRNQALAIAYSYFKKADNSMTKANECSFLDDVYAAKENTLIPSDIDVYQLAMGIQVEFGEHTNDIQIAMQIAMDHLEENPVYYTKLQESGLVDEVLLHTYEISNILRGALPFNAGLEPMEKARITKYVRRVPKPSGKGYIYFYNKAEYEHYKKTGELPTKQKSIFSKIISFFGLGSDKEAKEKIDKMYESHKTVLTGVGKDAFTDHVIEYITNKEKWDKKLSAPKAERKESKEGAKKEPTEKKKVVKKEGKKFNISVMRVVAGIVNEKENKKQNAGSKDKDNFETMPKDEKKWYENILEKIENITNEDDKSGLKEWISDWTNTKGSVRKSLAKDIEDKLSNIQGKEEKNKLKENLSNSRLKKFEDSGKEAFETTKKDWVEMQREERRIMGQNEGNGNPNAPYSDYENYHNDSVRRAIEEGKTVSPEVLKDYPELKKDNSIIKEIDKVKDEIKKQINTEEDIEDEETKLQKESDEHLKQKPEKVERPSVLDKGGDNFWNGKIYGNEKYGFNIYLNNEKEVIPKSVAQKLEQYVEYRQKLKSWKEKQETIDNKQLKFKNKNEQLQQIIDKPIEHIKKIAEDNFLTQVDGMFVSTDYTGAKTIIVDDVKEQKLIDRMKEWTPKDFKEMLKERIGTITKESSKKENEVNTVLNKTINDSIDNEFVEHLKNIVKNRLIELKAESLKQNKDKEEQDKKNKLIQEKINEAEKKYIPEGYWNGKVYGRHGNYNIYVDNKKRAINDNVALELMGGEKKSMSKAEELEDMLKAKKAITGEVHTYKNGKKYRKEGDKWVLVTSGKNKVKGKPEEKNKKKKSKTGGKNKISKEDRSLIKNTLKRVASVIAEALAGKNPNAQAAQGIEHTGEDLKSSSHKGLTEKQVDKNNNNNNKK